VSSRLQWWFDSALLVLPGLIWGASFLFIAEALEAVGPYGLAFLRIAIGFAVLSLFPAARRAMPATETRGTLALGVLWMAVPLTMFALAEQHVSSALTGMLNGATPLFVAIVAAAMAGRLPSSATRIGLAVGFAGAVIMAIPDLGTSQNFGQDSTIGVLEILVALVCYGFALNIARGLQQRNGALPVIWRAQGMALLLTAPLGLPEVFEARWSLQPLLALLALGAFGTAVAFVLAATAAGRLGATRASATTFLIPPVALVLGVLARDEHVQFWSVFGAAVCLAGAWLLRRAQTGQPRPQAAPSVARA
jgi:drug/metabolite transporter (DMT)-like permease